MLLTDVHAKYVNTVVNLHLKLKKGKLFITAVHFPQFLKNKSLKWGEGNKMEEKGGKDGKVGKGIPPWGWWMKRAAVEPMVYNKNK
jgi:hypothetical protein